MLLSGLYICVSMYNRGKRHISLCKCQVLTNIGLLYDCIYRFGLVLKGSETSVCVRIVNMNGVLL